MKIKWDSWVAKFLFGITFQKTMVGITINRTIYIRYTREYLVEKDGEYRVERLLKHERKHVEQYERYGFCGFLWKYFWQWIKYGYYDMPLEKEARRAESL